MGPGRAVGEALQEQGGGDGAAGAAVAGVLHIGDRAVDVALVEGRDRHPPSVLTDLGTSGEEVVRQFVGVREHPGVFETEGHNHGARQGRQIEHEFRLEPFLGIPEAVGEDETALGVGVDNLHRLPRERHDHIARTLGRAIRHVLDKADDADHIDLGLAAGKRMHEADHGGGTAHVPLHLLHAVGRLDRDAAGVEGHALADEGDRLVALLAAVPLHDDDLAIAHAPLTNGQQGTEAELLELLFAQNLDLEAELLEGLHALRIFFRVEDVGGLGDEVARELDRAGDRGIGGVCGFGGLGIGGDDADDLDRRSLLGLQCGAVFEEAVGRQTGGEGGARGLIGGQGVGVDGQGGRA